MVQVEEYIDIATKIYKNKFISDNFFIVFFVAMTFLLMIQFFTDKANLINTDISNLTSRRSKFYGIINLLIKAKRINFIILRQLMLKMINIKKILFNIIIDNFKSRQSNQTKI